MRASSRRSHHSSAVRSGREAAAHGEAFGFERRQRGGDLGRRKPERSGSASPRDRTQPLEPAAQDFDQRLLARPFALGIGGRRRDRRIELRRRPQRLELRQALGGDPQRAHCAAIEPRHAPAARASSDEPARSSPDPAFALRRVAEEAEPDQRIVQLVGVRRPRATPRRARARSPRDRAGRYRRRPPARASAGSSPPGCGAPPAAHRRDRRRDAPTAPRAPAARARSGRARRLGCRPPRSRRAARSRPARSIASLRQSPMVWRTSG